MSASCALRHNEKSDHLRLCCTELQLDYSARSPLVLSVISMGCEPARFLQLSETGSVLTVFKRCFYVQCSLGVFCTGTPSLGEGPMHVLLDSDDLDFLTVVSQGALINLSGYSRSNAHKRVPLTGNSVFSGCVSVNTLQPSSVSLIKQNLVSISVIGSGGSGGFGWVVDVEDWQEHSKINKLTRAGGNAVDREFRKLCVPSIALLAEWLRSNIKQDAEATPNFTALRDQLPLLLGAGPGLTPAGDDLLAGVLLGLHHCGYRLEAHALWSMLKRHVNSRTNPVSAAHLGLAAQGRCAEPVQRLLYRVFTGNTDIHTLADSIGASSGWDLLAGMTLVARAL